MAVLIEDKKEVAPVLLLFCSCSAPVLLLLLPAPSLPLDLPTRMQQQCNRQQPLQNVLSWLHLGGQSLLQKGRVSYRANRTLYSLPTFVCLFTSIIIHCSLIGLAANLIAPPPKSVIALPYTPPFVDIHRADRQTQRFVAAEARAQVVGYFWYLLSVTQCDLHSR